MKITKEFIERVTVTGRNEERKAAWSAFDGDEWCCTTSGPKPMSKKSAMFSKTHFKLVFERYRY